jgi:hypothetical protein
MLARAIPDPRSPGIFRVQIAVDLQGVQLSHQDGKWMGAVDLSFHIENSNSLQVITRTIDIPDDQLATALEKGISVIHTVEWHGKATGLRVAVEDKASGSAGSLRIPLGRGSVD